MLGKLIKYEFKASGRILFPIYIATPALALISGFFYMIPDGAKESVDLLKFITVLMMTLYGFCVFFEIAIGVIVSVFRFKGNLFGSEGYLMNTLPVKTNEHITSKLIVSVLYQIIGIAVAFISGILFFGLTGFYEFIDLKYFFYEFYELLLLYPASTIAYMTEGILLIIASLSCAMLTFFASISIGHSANTKKVAKSVWAYIGFYWITQIIGFIFMQIVVELPFIEAWMNSEYAGHILLTGGILAEVIYGSIYYLITNYFMEKRLNLQ